MWSAASWVKDQENGTVGVGTTWAKASVAFEELKEVQGGWSRAGGGPRGGQKGRKGWYPVPCGKGCRSVLRAVGSPKYFSRVTRSEACSAISAPAARREIV